MIKVLSIDGGGIRGIIPAIMLTEIEYRTHKPIYQLFDLMVGTSTGGILTLGLNKPDPQNPTQAQYTAETLSELYLKKGKQIFPTDFMDRLGISNILNEKYSATGIESLLESYFGDVWLSQSLKTVIVTSYEIHKRDTWLFKNLRANKDRRYDFKMRDVARATSAAPTYFEPAMIKPAESHDVYHMIDGGMYANNPSMIAFVEVLKNYQDERDQGCLLISLGTGETHKPILYKDAKDWGLLHWAKPTVDILFSATSHAIHNQLNIIFSNYPDNFKYHRFQCRLDISYSEMDRTEDEFLDYYASLAKRMIIDTSREIDQICKLLTD